MVYEKFPEILRGTFVVGFCNFVRPIIRDRFWPYADLVDENLLTFQKETGVVKFWGCTILEFPMSHNSTLQLCPCTMVEEKFTEFPKGTWVVEF